MTDIPELLPYPKPDCPSNITMFQWPDPKYPEQRTLYSYSCSCGWKAPYSDSEEGAARPKLANLKQFPFKKTACVSFTPKPTPTQENE